MTDTVSIDLDDLRLSATAALFEGGPRAGAGVSMFVVRTKPGGFVELHLHPYRETFVLLEGHARWSAGNDLIEAQAEQIVTVPSDTPHGFRNIGEVPLLVVSVHESPKLIQENLGEEPA